MRKLLIGGVVGIAAAAILFLGLAAGGSRDSVASADNNAATVIGGFACGILDGNGVVVGTTNSMAVITQSANGNAMLRCQADVTPPSSGQAARFDNASTGLLCSIPGVGATANWHETVSADGHATLICKSP